MQPPRYVSIEHSEKMKESDRKIKDKNILNKQTNNQETFNKTILGWIIKKKTKNRETLLLLGQSNCNQVKHLHY